LLFLFLEDVELNLYMDVARLISRAPTSVLAQPVGQHDC